MNRTRRPKVDVKDSTLNRILAILATVFFVIMIIMIAVMIFLSTGGSNKSKKNDGFFTSSVSAPAKSSSSSAADGEKKEESSSSSDKSDKDKKDSGSTIEVLAGEGEAAIAARAGISIAELERLNPSYMSSGSWYANPGDKVRVE